MHRRSSDFLIADQKVQWRAQVARQYSARLGASHPTTVAAMRAFQAALIERQRIGDAAA